MSVDLSLYTKVLQDMREAAKFSDDAFARGLAAGLELALSQLHILSEGAFGEPKQDGAR